jgi:hypothetical protein
MVHENQTFKMKGTTRTSKQDKMNVAVEQNIGIHDEKYNGSSFIT